MNMFMNSDAILSQQQQQSFTHINPNQVFGQHMSQPAYPGVVNGYDEASSWGYSPSNSGASSVGATPPSATHYTHHPMPLGLPLARGGVQQHDSQTSQSQPGSSQQQSGEGSTVGARSGPPSRSASSTALNQSDKEPATICSNCNTTKTPLWRRDPDGNPLCEFLFARQCKRG